RDLRPGDQIVVLTWLHLSPRDELSTHPQGDLSQPLTGVFSTCSPNRPNPVGLHRARIVARDGLRIEVDALEAIDGTPVVDVKPHTHAPTPAGDITARGLWGAGCPVRLARRPDRAVGRLRPRGSLVSWSAGRRVIGTRHPGTKRPAEPGA